MDLSAPGRFLSVLSPEKVNSGLYIPYDCGLWKLHMPEESGTNPDLTHRKTLLARLTERSPTTTSG